MINQAIRAQYGRKGLDRQRQSVLRCAEEQLVVTGAAAGKRSWFAAPKEART